jgi:hypothetical protein
VLQGEATATVVVVDSDSVVSVVDLEEDLGEVKAAEVDSDSGEETAAAKAREAPADLDSAARVEVVTAKVEAAMDLDLVATVEVVTAKVEAGKATVEEVVKAKVVEGEDSAAAKEVAAKEAGREEETEVDSAMAKEAAKAVVDLEVVGLEVVMEKAKEEARGEDSAAGSAEDLEEATAGAKVADLVEGQVAEPAVPAKEEEV